MPSPPVPTMSNTVCRMCVECVRNVCGMCVMRVCMWLVFIHVLFTQVYCIYLNSNKCVIANMAALVACNMFDSNAPHKWHPCHIPKPRTIIGCVNTECLGMHCFGKASHLCCCFPLGPQEYKKRCHACWTVIVKQCLYGMAYGVGTRKTCWLCSHHMLSIPRAHVVLVPLSDLDDPAMPPAPAIV